MGGGGEKPRWGRLWGRLGGRLWGRLWGWCWDLPFSWPRRFSSLFWPPVPCQTVGGPCGYEPGGSVGVQGRGGGAVCRGDGVWVCTGGGRLLVRACWASVGVAAVASRRDGGGSANRKGGCSWVAVAGVSGGGGEPRRPAVVDVDVMRLGGGQYCWWNWG